MAFKTIKMDDGSVLEPDEYAEDFSKVVKHKKVTAAVAVVKHKRQAKAVPVPTVDDRKEEILRLHSEIIEAVRTTVPKAIRIGELLTSIKAGLPHGSWMNWCDENIPFTQRSVERYMSLWDNRAEFDNLSDLDLSLFDAYKLLPHKLRGDPKLTPEEKHEQEREEMHPEPVSEAPVIEAEVVEPKLLLETEPAEAEIETAPESKDNLERPEEQVGPSSEAQEKYDKIMEGSEWDGGETITITISRKLFWRAERACNTLYQRNMNSDKQRTVVTLAQFVSRAIIKECNRVEKEEAEIDHGLLNRILSSTTTDEDFKPKPEEPKPKQKRKSRKPRHKYGPDELKEINPQLLRSLHYEID